jgi:hypothetical protein
MNITNTESNRKRNNDSEKFSTPSDRTAHIIAEKFALTLPHAREVTRLAGLGSDAEARQ